MSLMLRSSIGLDAPRGRARHLVVKRGHHGRYRFVLLSDGDRIAGEVRVDEADRDRKRSRTIALASIASLAESLLASVTTLSAIEEAAESGEGDHRGQV